MSNDRCDWYILAGNDWRIVSLKLNPINFNKMKSLWAQLSKYQYS